MESKTDVIYARYSSELQRAESIQDQERRCRDHLERMGIAHDHFELVKDEAISGTQDSRPGYDQLKELIQSGRLGKLVVTEQSRLTRGDNAKSMIKDIITEGIDMEKKGRQMLVGFSEIHHSRSNEDTAERVRGGQKGRVLDGDGSAGDYPYGYTSEYVDLEASLNYHGRGAKPRKRVVIHEPAATVVLEVFARFTAGESISSITRWLTKVQHEIPRIGNGDWHHQHVRRILSNPKYIGTWPYGKTTTVRDSAGKKKQVPARADQKVVTVERAHLRIVEQSVWDKAQAKLAQLMKVYGMKAGGRRRGPAEYYRLLYPKTLLGGLIHCSQCGSRMITGGCGKVKRMKCPTHRAGRCAMRAQVHYARAEADVLNLFEDVLLNYPGWLDAVVVQMRCSIEQMASTAPNELLAAQAQLAHVDQEIDNLVAAVASGVNSPSIRQRLFEQEQAKATLTMKVGDLQRVQAAPLRFPDDQWIREQLEEFGGLLQSQLPQAAPVLRAMLGKVVAEEVKIPGKKRAYARLRFRINRRGSAARSAWREAAGISTVGAGSARAERRVRDRPRRADPAGQARPADRRDASRRGEVGRYRPADRPVAGQRLHRLQAVTERGRGRVNL